MATATTLFATTVGDEEVIVLAGEGFPDDDPIVKAHLEAFGSEPRMRATAKRTTKKT